MPPPPSSIQLTPLLGAAPSAHLHTLHSLYTSQIATIVWEQAQISGRPRTPVVVGVALKSLGVREPENQDENMGLSDEERETFIGVMDMVRDVLDAK